jgi:hypothetical protein
LQGLVFNSLQSLHDKTLILLLVLQTIFMDAASMGSAFVLSPLVLMLLYLANLIFEVEDIEM